MQGRCRTYAPLVSGTLPRKCACGGTCAKYSDHTHENNLMLRPARATGLIHDFRRVGVFAGDAAAAAVQDQMVIADAPGWCRTVKESDFPVTYSGDFGLYAFDPLNMNILANVSYHVEISKTYFGQIDPVNTVTVTDRKIGSSVKSPVPPKK
jgi:hypothetical protein